MQYFFHCRGLIGRKGEGTMRDLTAPPSMREAVVLLHYYEGYKAREIAQLLHVRTNTVVSRLKRAREQLKPMLKEWYYEENI